MSRSVVIDCFFDGDKKYPADYAIVAIDVIRATTTAITAVDLGRDCYPVSSLEMALTVTHFLENPILCGELGGNMPFGFEIQNSPTQLLIRTDVQRPLILLSTSGTKLIKNYETSNSVYIACLRNYEAMTNFLADEHTKVALIGAGTREEFREEDQLCCAWIANGLIQQGFIPENEETEEFINTWKNSAVDVILNGKSAEYLRRSKQEADLDFILKHINDNKKVYRMERGKIKEITFQI